MTFWGRNRLCKALTRDVKQHEGRAFGDVGPPLLVNMTFGCQKMFDTSHIGTGNWLWLIYSMRLATIAHGNVDFHASCRDDSSHSRKRLVLPWVLGHFRPHEDHSIAPSISLMKQACSGHLEAPFWHMIPALQRDLRRMAQVLVGMPEWYSNRLDNMTKSAPETSYINSVELDETV